MNRVAVAWASAWCGRIAVIRFAVMTMSTFVRKLELTPSHSAPACTIVVAGGAAAVHCRLTGTSRAPLPSALIERSRSALL